MQDRKRLLSLPICPESSHSSNLPPLPPVPPSGAAPIIINNATINSSYANNGASSSGSLKVKMVMLCCSSFATLWGWRVNGNFSNFRSHFHFITIQPKPILVDKQSSEPNSPIAKTFEQDEQDQSKRPPMHRGFSDLGNRMKKRVTMRCVEHPSIHSSINHTQLTTSICHFQQFNSNAIREPHGAE